MGKKLISDQPFKGESSLCRYIFRKKKLEKKKKLGSSIKVTKGSKEEAPSSLGFTESFTARVARNIPLSFCLIRTKKWDS